MGALRNISFWGSALTGTGPQRGASRPNAAPAPDRRPGAAIALAFLALFLLASPAGADESRTTGAAESPDEATGVERSVSTSPQPGPPGADDATRPRRTDTAMSPVLTRAAARERIDSMSPIGWLESYGNVRVGRVR